LILIAVYRWGKIIIQIISWYTIQQLKANLWNIILLTTVPKIRSWLKESILFNILYLIGCILWSSLSPPRKRGRPHVYSSPTVILRCFIVRIWWFRQDSNNALHTFLNMNCCQYNPKLVVVSGLIKIPNSRRTFDRRLKIMSSEIRKDTGNGIPVCCRRYGWSIYNSNRQGTLLKAKGCVWHKSSIRRKK
jgi:hypothetical protein